MTNPNQARIDEIKTRMEEMQNTLEGCDWCCGGGDAEWDDYIQELKDLGGKYDSPDYET